MYLNTYGSCVGFLVLGFRWTFEDLQSDLLFVCRYTSESSVSLNRSPGQPSSYRSDEELMAVLDSLRGAGADGCVCSTGQYWAGLSLINRFSQSTGVSVFLISILSSIRVSGDPFSKLPVPHKLAILATMDEVSFILRNVSYQAATQQNEHKQIINTTSGREYLHLLPKNAVHPKPVWVFSQYTFR